MTDQKDAHAPTPMIFELGCGPDLAPHLLGDASERDQKVRHKAFHDAYLCAARLVEESVKYSSKECKDAVRELQLIEKLRRLAAEVKAVALS